MDSTYSSDSRGDHAGTQHDSHVSHGAPARAIRCAVQYCWIDLDTFTLFHSLSCGKLVFSPLRSRSKPSCSPLPDVRGDPSSARGGLERSRDIRMGEKEDEEEEEEESLFIADAVN